MEPTPPLEFKRTVFYADLDRCEHGRHQGDRCFGCPDGESTGNPVAVPGTTPRVVEIGDGRCGVVIAFALDGNLWVLVSPDSRGPGSEEGGRTENVVWVSAAALRGPFRPETPGG